MNRTKERGATSKKSSKKNQVSQDLQTKIFWSDSAHFADLFNTVIFSGEDVIKVEELQEMDSNVSGILEGKLEGEGLIRIRDVVKKSAYGTEFVVLGIENQSTIHYGMPLRAMLYDGLGYMREVESIIKKNKQEREVQKQKGKSTKMRKENFLCGLYKSDTITPIITVIVYYGEQAWDGPRCLVDMMGDIPEKLKSVVSDYKMNLIEILREDASEYQNREVRQVLEFSQAFMNADEEKIKELSEQHQVARDTAYMIGSIINSKKQMEQLIKEEEEEEVDMCKLLEDIEERGRIAGYNSGKSVGYNSGRSAGRMESIANLMKNVGMTAEEAMNAMGIPVAEQERYLEGM